MNRLLFYESKIQCKCNRKIKLIDFKNSYKTMQKQKQFVDT